MTMTHLSVYAHEKPRSSLFSTVPWSTSSIQASKILLQTLRPQYFFNPNGLSEVGVSPEKVMQAEQASDSQDLI